jgi:hypothetical protein
MSDKSRRQTVPGLSDTDPDAKGAAELSSVLDGGKENGRAALRDAELAHKLQQFASIRDSRDEGKSHAHAQAELVEEEVDTGVHPDGGSKVGSEISTPEDTARPSGHVMSVLAAGAPRIS